MTSLEKGLTPSKTFCQWGEHGTNVGTRMKPLNNPSFESGFISSNVTDVTDVTDIT